MMTTLNQRSHTHGLWCTALLSSSRRPPLAGGPLKTSRAWKCKHARQGSSLSRTPTTPLAAATEQGGVPAEEEQPLWSSGLSQDPEAGMEEAVAEAVRQGLETWPAGGPPPELAFVFVSSSYQRRYEQVLPLLLEKLPSLRHVLGCSGYGVLGTRRGAPEEWEAQPALSLTLARLPGVALQSFYIPPTGLPDADAPPQAWHELVGVPPSEEGQGRHNSFVLISDAAFGGVTDLLAGLDYAYPAARKAGGLNSGASVNTRRVLWQWCAENNAEASSDGLHDSGCVGLALQGPLIMDTIVAQGCRPLGEGVYSVAKAHRSLVLEVQPEGAAAGGKRGGGMAPVVVLQEQLAKLPAEERDRAARNLMVGLAPDDWKPAAELGPGDFLVRAILGADPGSGAVMIGDVVRVGQRLQFMVRDREGAMHDLVSHGVDLKKRELSASLAGNPLPPALGCLIFTCNGRGRGLYRMPHYDSRTLAEYVPAPSAGFFCNGEIGQVQNTTYLHGFTMAAAIFRPAPQQTGAQQLGEQQVQQQQQQGLGQQQQQREGVEQEVDGLEEGAA